MSSLWKHQLGSDRSSQTTRFLSKHLSPLTGSGGTAVDDDGAGCDELYSMLQKWVDDRSCAPSARVQAGNLAYESAFQVCRLILVRT